MQLIKFLASASGRWVRMLAGILLMAVGLLVIQNMLGIVVAVIGLVPLIAGLADVCLFAPLFGAPLSGKAIRSAH